VGIRTAVLADFDLRLEPGVRAPQEARRSLEPLRSRLDDRLVAEAMLLVSEIVTNSVRHADLGAEDEIQVRVRATPSSIRVEVLDPGRGFHPDAERDGDAAGGWGLWLLAKIAKRWGIEHDDLTRVWFELGAVSDAAAEGIRRKQPTGETTGDRRWVSSSTRRRATRRKRSVT
jgi:anti-sigma regulatory factor (Ser/Thr protein kinase)